MCRRALPRTRRPPAVSAAAQRRGRTLVGRLTTASTFPWTGLALARTACDGTSRGEGNPRSDFDDRWATRRPSHGSWAGPWVTSRSPARGMGSGSHAIGNAWATWAMPCAPAKRMRRVGRAEDSDPSPDEAGGPASSSFPELASSFWLHGGNARGTPDCTPAGSSHCALPFE